MNYLVVDGANSLKQGCVWWCPRLLNPSSWGILSTCASALSTDTSSEPRAIVGFAECHHVEIDKNWLASGRTVTTSTALRVLLLWLLATQPLELIEMIDLLEANHCLRVTESKLGLLHYFEFQKTFFCSATAPWFRKCMVGYKEVVDQAHPVRWESWVLIAHDSLWLYRTVSYSEVRPVYDNMSHKNTSMKCLTDDHHVVIPWPVT
jgi:hypothetical protein